MTEGLGRRYGETEALSGLDLTVEPGTVLGLLGHNGAGKTTAVRILSTLLAPTSGRAFVAGHDVVADPRAVRESISLAGQQATLDERLTGRENLMLLARLQKLSKRAAVARGAELLARFGLEHAADRLLGTYSGGMRRRLDLAACLVVHRPGGCRDRRRGSRAQPADARRRVLRTRGPTGADGGMTATLNEVRFLAGRSLRHIPRIPEKAFGAVLLPLVFVLLFVYVFGSAIRVPGGGDYHTYLVSGIFAQTMIGTVPGIAVGVASDIRSGLMDRLRTLPIARGSVIAGRTVAELVELCGGMVVVALCGLIVGWAPHGSLLETAAGFALLLLMAFAVTWAGVWVGLMVRDPDGADGIAMAVIFPAMFLSGIFVPVSGLPDGLRQIAELNPLTSLAFAVRQLWHSPVGTVPDVFTLQHPIITSLLWAAILMAIFVSLSIRRYQRMGR